MLPQARHRRVAGIPVPVVVTIVVYAIAHFLLDAHALRPLRVRDRRQRGGGAALRASRVGSTRRWSTCCPAAASALGGGPADRAAQLGPAHRGHRRTSSTRSPRPSSAAPASPAAWARCAARSSARSSWACCATASTCSDVSSFFQQIVIGIVIIAAVLVGLDAQTHASEGTMTDLESSVPSSSRWRSAAVLRCPAPCDRAGAGRGAGGPARRAGAQDPRTAPSSSTWSGARRRRPSARGQPHRAGGRARGGRRQADADHREPDPDRDQGAAASRPRGSKEIVPAIAKANAAGIRVVVVDTRVDPKAAKDARHHRRLLHRLGQLRGRQDRGQLPRCRPRAARQRRRAGGDPRPRDGRPAAARVQGSGQGRARGSRSSPPRPRTGSATRASPSSRTCWRRTRRSTPSSPPTT